MGRRILLALLTGIALSVGVCGQEAASALLMKPAASISVDGSPLGYAAPQILIFKDTPEAQFVSAIWKDAAGQPVHQRSVFLVKSGYGVAVDYVLGKDAHQVARILPSGVSGMTFQPLDPPAGFSSTVKAPAPVASAFYTEMGAAVPKVDYVKPANPMIVKCRLTFPNGEVDQVAIAWESRPLHLEGKEFKGWAACLRQGPGGTSSIEIQ